MSLLNGLLHITNFRSPLLRAIVPCVAAAFAIQGAVAVPSIIAQSERFFDVSGSVTYLAVGALSLFLPALRARAATAAEGATNLPALPSLLDAFKGNGVGDAALNWRQVALTGLVMLWATRLGTYLFHRILKTGEDSRFEKIRSKPARFTRPFIFQAIWVSLQLMPVLALNAVAPSILASALPQLAATDALGLAVWFSGFTFEVVADVQRSKWKTEQKLKLHDEEFMASGLFSKCRFPHYFGEITLWTGVATTAASVLARKPIQQALGYSGGPLGILATTALSFVSPAFVTLLLTKVSGVPLSDRKYDRLYGDRKEYQEWKKNTPTLIPKLW
ncbi:hypothetical protein PT974_11891 [Cladobotryum mycophilum]|uniref:Steroid 5-alpha reductase C-terminal domain-containing protein n=1 Tax=Cladobotryum mycophilum TaxID=491253 RepID=A0ABR0S6G7_9HYPO